MSYDVAVAFVAHKGTLWSVVAKNVVFLKSLSESGGTLR